MDKVKSFFAALTMDDGWTPMRDEDGEIMYGVLTSGMNNLNLSWYLNHSEDPNVAFKDAEEDGGYNSFVTRRRIEAGEEPLLEKSGGLQSVQMYQNVKWQELRM
ncbi:unnamed protein product [Symbiodinium sp. CCMP2592]|nr:unnamed protein product [Symbiodinium sp. CCMP2592]